MDNLVESNLFDAGAAVQIGLDLQPTFVLSVNEARLVNAELAETLDQAAIVLDLVGDN